MKSSSIYLFVVLIALTTFSGALHEVSAATPVNANLPEVSLPDADGGAAARMTYRSLDETPARKSITEAYDILNTTIDVMDFREADLQDVLRLIAAKSRLNIIMSPDGVQGKVTLHLENVRLGVALENILKTNGLAYVLSAEENIVRIVDASSVGLDRIETSTEVIQLNWVDATKLANTLKPLFSQDTVIIPNPDTNSLIVTSTPPDMVIVRELVAQADMAERQVLIEARLVDLTIEARRLLGMALSAWRVDSSGNSFVTDGAGNAFDFIDSFFPVNTGGLGMSAGFGDVVSIFGQSFNLAAQMQALENRNLVEILANPKVVTLNNIPATISIIQKVPYTESVIGVSGATTIQVEFADAGVQIDVTPIITANGFVRMSLKTSQKIFRGRVGQGELDPPLIDNRDATTNVIVRGSETVMIGGLREMRNAESSAQIPWFGRIPVLGWLFKNKLNEQAKTELVLFVTPTIIEEPEMTAGDLEQYDRINAKWHLPDYFFDDVQTRFER